MEGSKTYTGKAFRLHLSSILETVAEGLNRIVFPISFFCGKICAFIILIMAGLIGVDILTRLIANYPIAEVVDVEQFLLAMVVFLSLAYTQTQKGHVSVDILSSKFSPKLAMIMDCINSSLGGVVFLVIGWQLLAKAHTAFLMGEVAYVTNLPYAPFLVLAALGCALMVLLLLVDFFRSLSRIFQSFSTPFFWAGFTLAVAAATIVLPVIMLSLSIELAPFTAGCLGVGFLMLLLGLGLPIGVAMGLVGILGTWYLKGLTTSLGTIYMSVFGSVSEYLYTVIPFFVAMGFLAFASDLSGNLYTGALKLFGKLKGSLALATIFGCAGFASICGDSMATAATMGSVALPEMRKRKYQDALATGCLAAGGTLGILIPPSIGFIAYGIVTQQSIGKLFIAGIIPGICLATLFILITWIRCKVNPTLGPAGPATTIPEKFKGILLMWPILFLFFFVMGGMWFGFFTPTEAGAVGLISAAVIGLIMRKFSYQSFSEALMQTVQVTTMIFTILIGVVILGFFISTSEVPLKLAGFVQGLGLNRYVILIIVLLIYVVLGCLMNIIPMIMLTLPMIFPTVSALGFDPIWFGVIMVIIMEMGQITPPVGINVFVIKGVANVPMGTIFQGVWPFLAAQCLMILILVLFPDIALVLPNAMQTLAPIGK